VIKKIISFINHFLKQEKAVIYSMLGTIWRILFAPISMYLITLKLTPELQGYYYLFFSIAGMQQIFEVGFSHTLVQGISHEMGKISFFNGILKGDNDGVFKIEETLRLGFAWYFILGLCCVLIVCPVGMLIMQNGGNIYSQAWFYPWLIFILLFSLNLVLYPINFFIEGLQQIEKIYKVRFIIQIISGLIFALFLFLDFNLLSIIAMPLASIIVNLLLLYMPLHLFFNKYIFRFPSKKFVKSILKWQLKVGFVWSSGYLYWQLPIVVIFKFLGPTVSGQYSMSANIINAIMNVGQIFVRTKAAIIGELRASNKIAEAARIYKKSIKISYITVFIGFICFFLIWFFIPEILFFNRMLPMESTFILFIIFLMTLNTLNQAMYARCSKEEPFFYVSMFVNFGFPVILFSALFISSSITSVLISFFILHCVEVIWGNKIFKKVKYCENISHRIINK
jgi:O-antigen/teichoic acid export membrane protein